MRQRQPNYLLYVIIIALLAGIALTFWLSSPIDAKTRFGSDKCFSLPGDAYASHVDDPALNMGVGDFGIGLWLNTTSTSRMVLFHQGAADYHYLEVNNTVENRITLRIHRATGGAATVLAYTESFVINDGKWHHIFGTTDRDGLGYIYVDGVVGSMTNNDFSSLSATSLPGATYLAAFNGTLFFTDGRIALAEQFYFGFNGLPTVSGATPADYAEWRWRNPYAHLSQFAGGAWSGYADALRTDAGELVTGGAFDTDTTEWWSKEAGTLVWNAGTTDATYTANGNTGQNNIHKGALLTKDEIYEVRLRAKSSNLTSVLSPNFGDYIIEGGWDTNPNLTTTYQDYIAVGKALHSTGTLAIYFGLNLANGKEVTVDDITIKRVGNCGDWPMDGNLVDGTSNGLDLTSTGTYSWPYSTIRAVRLDGAVGKTRFE